MNASWETVKMLAKKGLGDGIDLVTYEIPVEYETVKDVVPKYWKEHAPDVSFIFSCPVAPEFRKWTLPSLGWDMSNDANRGFSLKSKTDCKQFRS